MTESLKSSKLEWLESINATYCNETKLITYSGYSFYIPLTDSRTLKEFRMEFYRLYSKKKGCWENSL